MRQAERNKGETEGDRERRSIERPEGQRIYIEEEAEQIANKWQKMRKCYSRKAHGEPMANKART